VFGSLKVSIGLFSINICNAVQYISSKVRLDFLIYIYIYISFFPRNISIMYVL